MLTHCKFFQLGPLYANIRHDPRSEYNPWKNEHSEHQQNWGVGYVLRPQCFRWQSPLRLFLGSKEHLDWLNDNLTKKCPSRRTISLKCAI